MKKIRLGIIGPGIIWERAHKPVLVELKDKFEIAAFCASSDRSREKIKKEYPNLPFFKDYKKLLEMDSIDTVLVLAPLTMNAMFTMAALDAGKDVITEKPMASSTAEGKKLIAREKKTGKKVLILEQSVYEKTADILLDTIRSKKIGDLIFYDRLFHAYIGYKENDDLNYGNTKWRIKPDFILGTLLDSGIHEIAMLGKVFGQPLSVYAAGTKYRKEYGDYDHNVVVFEYNDELKGVFSHSFFLGKNRNYFNIRGTEGIAWLDKNKILIKRHDGHREEIAFSQENVHLDMWKEIYDYLSDSKKPYYNTKVSLKDLEVLEAINRSLKKSCKVYI